MRKTRFVIGNKDININHYTGAVSTHILSKHGKAITVFA